MLNISRSVLLAVYAAALLSSNVSPMSSMLATASPIPNGLKTRTTVNRLSPASRTSTYLTRPQSRGGHAQPIIRSTAFTGSSLLGLDIIPQVLTNCNRGRGYNQRFAALASNSPQDPANRQATMDLLHEIHLWLQNIALLLRPMGAAKGLLNYDNNSELETALKDLINVNKDLLRETYLLSAEDFPELGDIVYDIKCIIEFLLDFTENTSDGVINDVGLGL